MSARACAIDEGFAVTSLKSGQGFWSPPPSSNDWRYLRYYNTSDECEMVRRFSDAGRPRARNVLQTQTAGLRKPPKDETARDRSEAVPRTPGLWGFDDGGGVRGGSAARREKGCERRQSMWRSAPKVSAHSDLNGAVVEKRDQGRHWARAAAAKDRSAVEVDSVRASQGGDGDHDVSILMAPGGARGRCRGERPRSKISMTIIRPPQQGHGCGSAF